MKKALLLEGIHDNAKEYLEDKGFEVTLLPDSPDPHVLKDMITDYHMIGIRSKTELTKDILEAAINLKAIGTFCIGTNQIDLQEITRRGIPVFNAPYSNTRSVVELSIGLMLMLIRRIFEKSTRAHRGIWQKSAMGCREIRGKKLGIIGYGSIGSQLSVLAEAMGMQVVYYDNSDRLPLGNAKKCATLKELLNTADFVSLHIDGRPENEGFISKKEFNQMKDGAMIINLARGNVVDIDDLVEALKSKKIGGAAIDVFPEEPKNNKEAFVNQLQGFDNVILSPHIGGSTIEAQEDIAQFVSNKFIEYFQTGNTKGSVNFPQARLEKLDENNRFIHIHKNMPGILVQIDQILSQHGYNIEAQSLRTNQDIGYVITDVDQSLTTEIILALESIPETIRVEKR